MPSSDKEKLICIKCRYETDYLGTYLKPPVCPTCKNLLSFKESGAVDPEKAGTIPWMNHFLLAVGLILLGASIWLTFRHFETWDARRLLNPRVKVGEEFFAGRSKSKISMESLRLPFNYEGYFKNPQRGRYFTVVKETHRYSYKGTQNGQILVDYKYENSKDKKGAASFSLRMNGNAAFLDIPPIPYVKNTRVTRLKLTPGPTGNLLVSVVFEENRKNSSH